MYRFLPRPIVASVCAFGIAMSAQISLAEVTTLEYTDGNGCKDEQLAIRVVVDNIRKGTGTIVADLHDEKPEDFLRGSRALIRIRMPASEGQTRFCIPIERPGTYAVGIYHDRNDNWKFDKNFFGIPKEAFGLSNNPRYGLRKPKLEEAAFEVPQDGADTVIRLARARDILN